MRSRPPAPLLLGMAFFAATAALCAAGLWLDEFLVLAAAVAAGAVGAWWLTEPSREPPRGGS